MVHDPSRGGQDDKAKLARGEQIVDPVLQLGKFDIKAGRDDTTLVETTVEMNDNLSRTVIINNLKLLNVTCIWGEEG